MKFYQNFRVCFYVLFFIPTIFTFSQEPETLPDKISNLEQKINNVNNLLNKLIKENNKKTALPIGTVIFYSGNTKDISSEWLLCNGTQVSQKQYPKLFAVLKK